jgi:hypothetical protein
MTVEARKLAESVQILNDYAEGLLNALYTVKRHLDPVAYPSCDTASADAHGRSPTLKTAQPRIFGDQTLSGTVKAFIKKFPESPDISKAPFPSCGV